MRLVVLQIDDRIAEDAVLHPSARSKDATMRLQFLADNQRRVAERGWEHDLRLTPYDADMPPWWWKVFAIRELMQRDAQPASLLVLWMDTDAMLSTCRMTDPLRLARCYPSSCMWISPDAPQFHLAPFNAGVFLVRGSPAGRRLMDAWCALYRPSHWTRIINEATPPSSETVVTGLERQPRGRRWRWQHIVGPWAGKAFEQAGRVRCVPSHPCAPDGSAATTGQLLCVAAPSRRCVRHRGPAVLRIQRGTLRPAAPRKHIHPHVWVACHVPV